MKNILIRRATLKDLDAVQKLNHELFVLEKQNFDSTLITDWSLLPEGKKYFEDLIKNEYVIFAIDDDSIIGYLAGSINDKCSYSYIQYGEINNMFIDNKYRRQGIGNLLIDRFKEYCAGRNIHNLKVVASAKNTNARDFYQKYGFNEFDVTFTMPIK